MARKLSCGAREAVGGVADAARHLAWYLAYCIDGSATRTRRSERTRPSRL